MLDRCAVRLVEGNVNETNTGNIGAVLSLAPDESVHIWDKGEL